MDLNQLYHEHQLSLMRGATLLCDAGGSVHREHASDIARKIMHLHRISGAKALKNWERTLAS